ncbi:MAG: hypothetical protein WBP41_15175 [Saprospiraceae bacterium]
MKLKILILSIACIVIKGRVNGQIFIKDIQFSLGIAIQSQDRRLFDYPHPQDIIKNENSNIDVEYHFILTKKILEKKIIDISTGIEYSQLRSTFSRPFDENFYTGSWTLLATYISKYTINSLGIKNSINTKIYNHGQSSFSINLPICLNFAFNKSVTSGYSHYNKFLLQFRNLEIYSGLKFQKGRFSTEADYRIFNFQKIDDSIFGGFLFITPNPPFLSKKNETLNLNKVMVTFSYQL